MFKQIESTELAHISGGAACPKYQASADVLEARSHMTASQRQAADKQWKQTVSHLSAPRLAEVQKQAVLNANTGACAVAEPLVKHQLETLKF
jgi:bacteriocin-like protein